MNCIAQCPVPQFFEGAPVIFKGLVVCKLKCSCRAHAGNHACNAIENQLKIPVAFPRRLLGPPLLGHINDQAHHSLHRALFIKYKKTFIFDMNVRSFFAPQSIIKMRGLKSFVNFNYFTSES